MGFEFGILGYGRQRMQERNEIRAKVAEAQEPQLADKSTGELKKLRDWLNPAKNARLQKFLDEVDDSRSWKLAVVGGGIAALLAGAALSAITGLVVPAWVGWAVAMVTTLPASWSITGESFAESSRNKRDLERATVNIDKTYDAALKREQELQLTRQKLDLIESRFGNSPALKDMALKTAFDDGGKTQEAARPGSAPLSAVPALSG